MAFLEGDYHLRSSQKKFDLSLACYCFNLFHKRILFTVADLLTKCQRSVVDMLIVASQTLPFLGSDKSELED